MKLHRTSETNPLSYFLQAGITERLREVTFPSGSSGSLYELSGPLPSTTTSDDGAKSSPGESEGQKRARAAKRYKSSLDFRVSIEQQGVLINPLPVKDTKTTQQRQQQQQPEQEQKIRGTSHQTRARGSSGIPPPKLLNGFSDLNLESMNEEQLMEALKKIYSGSSAGEELLGGPGDGKKRANSGKRRSRTSSRSFSKAYPAHIRDQMDEGIPVVQWIIVLGLVGIATYQLYLMVWSNNATKKRRAGTKTKVKAAAASSVKQNRQAKQKEAKRRRPPHPALQQEPTKLSSLYSTCSSSDLVFATDLDTRTKKNSPHKKKAMKQKETTASNTDTPKTAKNDENRTKRATFEECLQDDAGWYPVGKKSSKAKDASTAAIFRAKNNAPDKAVKAQHTPTPPAPAATEREEQAKEPFTQGNGHAQANKEESKLSSKHVTIDGAATDTDASVQLSAAPASFIENKNGDKNSTNDKKNTKKGNQASNKSNDTNAPKQDEKISTTAVPSKATQGGTKTSHKLLAASATVTANTTKPDPATTTSTVHTASPSKHANTANRNENSRNTNDALDSSSSNGVAGADGFQPTTNKKKKGKSKSIVIVTNLPNAKSMAISLTNNKTTTAAVDATTSTSVQDYVMEKDAALALQLQKEEEKATDQQSQQQQEEGKVAEEAWEEVQTKRSKKKSAGGPLEPLLPMPTRTLVQAPRWLT